jgi:hypothetical protein
MGLICPQCGIEGEFRIRAGLELPPDGRSDEITLQASVCHGCGLFSVTVYEESRRGSLDQDSFDHYGYRLDGLEFERLVGLITACPRPDDRRCSCPTHRQLSRTDDQGIWRGLSAFRLGPYFNVFYRP